ncbi:Variable major protein (plasmid) [Borrelia coriaceae ATCC 43381]|uniref:Variable large protein n=1 Tax=Borrelia coriaceae ATCC 43381 TaxID=1408429 RepID=W5SVW6_9SPIR|nr:Variable major protein [Borrelia coriaceae ATCC 43381]
MKINIRIKSICATLFIFLFLSCNNGIEELEKKNIFSDSLVNIGHEFQEIFGSFGNAIGNALGFSTIKPEDNRSEVKKHFDVLGERLKSTKNKLNDLSNKISGAKNADRGTIKVVEDVIEDSNEVFDKLIGALAKLSGATGSTDIGDNTVSAGVGAEKSGVEAIVGGIKTIVEEAGKAGMEIKPGDAGSSITTASVTTDAIVVLGGHNTAATKGAGPNLAAEVLKADPWAMIDKIKNATPTSPAKLGAGSHDAGKLASSSGNASASAGAKSNADLAQRQ